MEPVTFLVVGLSIGAASALSWNLYHARNALQNVSDRPCPLRISRAHAKQTTEALVLLQKKIDHYDDLLGAYEPLIQTLILVCAHTKRLLHSKPVLSQPVSFKMPSTRSIPRYRCKY